MQERRDSSERLAAGGGRSPSLLSACKAAHTIDRTHTRLAAAGMSSLYVQSAELLRAFLRDRAPLAQLVYSCRALADRQRKAAYALLLGTLRYKHLLDQVIESTSILKQAGRNANRALLTLMVGRLACRSTPHRRCRTRLESSLLPSPFLLTALLSSCTTCCSVPVDRLKAAAR